MSNIQTAIKLHQQGELHQAIALYHQGISQPSKDSGKVMQLLGIAYAQLDQYADAIKYFNLARDLVGDNHDLLDNLATAYNKNNQSEKAMAIYQAILQDHPEHHATLNNLGLLYYHKKTFNKAYDLFQQACKTVPTTANSFYNLARTQAILEPNADVTKPLEHALSLDPQHWPSISMLAQYYHHEQEISKARDYYLRA